MSKINDTTDYPVTVPAAGDMLIGTDVSDTSTDAGGETANFTVAALTTHVESNMDALQNVALVKALATYAPTRAEAILLHVPAAQVVLFVRNSAGLLAYKRDAAGTALTTADGQTWSPDGDVTPNHWAENTTPGTTDMTAALTAAMAYSTRVHVKSLSLIDAAVAVPSGVTLIFDGGSITATSTQTLSFNNKARIKAGRDHIFKGESTASNLGEVYPEWFGAQNSSVSAGDATPAAWVKAAAACRQNGVISLAEGFYPWDGTSAVVLSNGQRIKGSGWYQSTLRCVTAAANGFRWTTTNGGGAHGFRFQSVTVTPTSGVVLDFSGNEANRPSVTEIFVEGCYSLLRAVGNNTTAFNQGTFKDIEGRNVYGRVLDFDAIENLIIENIMIDAGVGAAPLGGLRIVNKSQGNIFRRVQIGNCKTAKGCEITSSGSGILRGTDPRWNQMISCVFDD